MNTINKLRLQLSSISWLCTVVLVALLMAIPAGTFVPTTADAQGSGVDLAVSFKDDPGSSGAIFLDVYNHGDVAAEGVRVVIELRGFNLDANNNADSSPVDLPVGKLVPVAGAPQQAVWEVGRLAPGSGYRIPNIVSIIDNTNQPSSEPAFFYFVATVNNGAPEELHHALRNNRAYYISKPGQGISWLPTDAVVDATVHDFGGSDVSFTITARNDAVGPFSVQLGTVVNVRLTSGLTYSEHTITHTNDRGGVSTDTDTDYDSNSGQWDIGDFDPVSPRESYRLTLTATVAADAVREEQCLTAEISGIGPEDVSPYGSSSQANNVAIACLGSPIVSDGPVSLLTWYDCIGETDYPCDRDNNANGDGFEVVAVGGTVGSNSISPDRVTQPRDVLVHVPDPLGRKCLGRQHFLVNRTRWSLPGRCKNWLHVQSWI